MGVAGQPQPGKPLLHVEAAAIAAATLAVLTPSANVLPQQSDWKITDAQSPSPVHARATGDAVPESCGDSGVGHESPAGSWQPVEDGHASGTPASFVPEPLEPLELAPLEPLEPPELEEVVSATPPHAEITPKVASTQQRRWRTARFMNCCRAGLVP